MTFAERARQLYDREWKSRLEESHRDQFIAIEPDSCSYYLGDSFVEAAMSARQAYPDRQAFVLKIGNEATFHLGAATK